MEELNKTIECICKRIQKINEFECISDECIITELVKALAELVSAKANLNMSVRIHSKGGSSQEGQNW